MNMENNFQINVAKIPLDFKLTNYESLKKLSFKSYDLEIEKSTTEKKLFTNFKAKKEIKSRIVYGISFIIFVTIFTNCVVLFNWNGFLIDSLVKALIFIAFFTAFATLLAPFTVITNIISDQNFKYGQNLICKKNIIGYRSVMMNFDSIDKIVIKEEDEFKYISFNAKGLNEILKESLIFKVNTKNPNEIIETEKLLNDITENSHHEIETIIL